MCGIAGFYRHDMPAEHANERLALMASRLKHRGPDAHGALLRCDVGLAHARLAIVGIADGTQPMRTVEDDLAISFNGEIFNHVELRETLSARGHHFRTHSDTEVILHDYRDKGLDCLNEFNGDFAFALHDARNDTLVLARDRMGVRPLYYTWHEGTFYFASEIGALLALPGMTAEIDPVALDQIFTFWFPLPPRTAFRGIHELPPGHLMILRDGASTVRRWWQLSYPDGKDAAPPASLGAQVEELTALLADATRIRLRADVPVGSYLSGGLDSSLVSALAAQSVSRGLRTFSLAFESAEHDESIWQKTMSQHLGVASETTECSTADIAQYMPEVMEHVQTPILRTAPVPLYLLSRHVRERGMKVVLTGEGADELFAGYDIFREARVRRFCSRQPQSARRPKLFQRLYPYLPGLKQQTPDYLARFFSFGAEATDEPLFSHRPRLRSTAAAKIFFSAELKAQLGDYDAAADLAAQLPEDFRRWHPLHQAQYLETAFLLPGYILSSQGDRVMMANGVEGRFPFLDPRVVDFAAALHPEAKLRGLKEKYILKQAAAELVPDAILNRPKQPYRAPDAEAFADAGYLDTVLSTGRVRTTGLFNAQAVEKLTTKVRQKQATGFRDNAAFVGILSTQLLHAATTQNSTTSSQKIEGTSK
ncbi:asparagine synthase (glutamine-hydrolyzing) [Agrobacterium tumefaciens]|uniref:asparagine synthase (glutamine-hydrolyzing) n=1 Tax=Agrobacterium tumefaciens TaxID=358 RepID=UPI000976DF0D|nr:asparagine synthase (glutamine-hydrolyzing) [Agrobacterium tumefaciens]UXR93364.1 asparagine synthase (glutamine-hydrolyzing) [Agrobacterium tumefaciens]